MKRNHVAVFAVLVVGLAGLAFYGARVLLAPPPEEGEEPIEEPSEPEIPLEGDEHFEKVRVSTREVYESFPGRISAEGSIPIRAPVGMRVPVVKIEKDVGDFVKKGDVLLRFDRPQIERAIEKAKKDGKSEEVARFQDYLAHCDLLSPVDGIVRELQTDLGEVPLDPIEGGGKALMYLTDRNSFSLKVQVPQILTKTLAYLGAKLTADLEGSFGKVNGTVSGYEPAPEGWTTLVVGLDAKEGLEPEMVANLRVPTSKREVALVSKAAVKDRKGVKIVRVWEPAERIVVERTILVEGEEDGDWVVVAGVFPGDNVVAPGREKGR